MELKNKGLIHSIKKAATLVGVLCLVFLVSLVVPIDQFGIRPRTLAGLAGILPAPLLHVNAGHLAANAMGLMVLGTIFFLVEWKNPFIVLMHFVVLGGFGTWLIGRAGTNHIGFSGVLYGMMGYLMSMGFFKKNITAIVVSAVCFILYGGALWGILPGNPLDSWESHLCGLVAGIVTAWSYAKARR